ncbi:hypothetical protein C8F01DRAFT_358861 [Mycena amicta]|nr:hypothetical protein C8F01DRAFT_358861 [Mycena amicta]
MRSLKISGKKLKGTAAGRAEHRGLSPVLDSEDITVLALPEIRSLATVRAQSIIDAECMHILATNTFPDSTEYLRLRLGVPDWRPLDLSVIPDSEYRPAGLWAVIALAIQGSRFKMLPLRGIISAISAHLKFYRDDPSDSWKETLRHTLSLYTCFKLVKRPFGGGMGGYWRVEFTAGKSTRPRKRKQKGVV